MFKHYFIRSVVLTVLFSISASSALAATTYTPSTQKEYIAYLQGVLAALQTQLAANAYGSSKVDTATPALKAEVTLKATYEIGSQSYVYAWFEYGVGTLSKKTTRTKVEKERGEREVSHRRVLTNLESDTVYLYRAVFETRSGDRTYGSVGTFSTSGNTSTGGSFSGGTTVSNSRGSLTLAQTTFEPGDSIEVEWTIPRSKEDTSNWIGIFKTSASNRDYIRWGYLDNDDKGTLTLKAPEEGTYELRLFYNNTYEDEVTSRRITVTD